MSILIVLFYAAGAFTIILGILHFTFPERFGFMQALPSEGTPLPPFRLLSYRHELRRSDLRGIVYVMNHCVSYSILAAGVFDLFVSRWHSTFPGALAAGTIAGFWFVRAATQFYLGHRKGDWLVVTLFVLLGALHVAGVVR